MEMISHHKHQDHHFNTKDKWDTSIRIPLPGGTWVSQSVERLTLAQVTISRIVSLSRTSGSVLTALSLESASDSVSLSHSAVHLLLLCLSLSVSLKNK